VSLNDARANAGDLSLDPRFAIEEVKSEVIEIPLRRFAYLDARSSP
jgi:hypothetical protein